MVAAADLYVGVTAERHYLVLGEGESDLAGERGEQQCGLSPGGIDLPPVHRHAGQPAQPGAPASRFVRFVIRNILPGALDISVELLMSHICPPVHPKYLLKFRGYS